MLQYIHDRITVDSDLCSGQPTIRGIRITVAMVLDFLGAGDSVEEVLESYPALEREDILACIRFALLTVQERYEPQMVLQ